MPVRLSVLFRVLFGLSCAAPIAAFAGDASLQQACFPPATLHAVDGEQRPVKGDHRYDAPAKSRELMKADPIAGDMRGAIRRVDVAKGDKVVALTFDLCEQRGEVAGYEGRIFDYLRSQGVKATLFAGGKWMASHQARTQQLMTDPLFELANHSETHRNLRLLDGSAVREEILAPQRVYEGYRAGLAATQCAAHAPAEAMQSVMPRLSLFRFPFGACNQAALDAVNDAGLLAIQWDLSTGDPDPRLSAEAIANTMVHRARPGSIIVGHANGRGWHTADALPLAIPKLKAMGFKFVTVSELLQRGKPVVSSLCYDNKPGDTDRYDFLGGLRPHIESGWTATRSVAPTPKGQTGASRQPAPQPAPF